MVLTHESNKETLSNVKDYYYYCREPACKIDN